MKAFKEGTIGKKPIGDPILANLVEEAIDLPRKLLNNGSLSGSFPLDDAMSTVLDYAEKVTNLRPKSRGAKRDAEYAVTRKRAMKAIWAVYSWMQDNASTFESIGTRSESEKEYKQRMNIGAAMISYDTFVEGLEDKNDINED